MRNTVQLNSVMKLSKTIEEIRSEFPILSIKVHGKPLVYLDNGATTQKPEQVIRVMEELYRTSNANVHRGVHRLSDMVSERYEAARETVRAFINAPKREEIIFTAGTTASINASCLLLRRKVRPRRRRDSHQRHGTPCQHRSVADALRKEKGET